MRKRRGCVPSSFAVNYPIRVMTPVTQAPSSRAILRIVDGCFHPLVSSSATSETTQFFASGRVRTGGTRSVAHVSVQQHT
jgi:hypothetical protein